MKLLAAALISLGVTGGVVVSFALLAFFHPLFSFPIVFFGWLTAGLFAMMDA